MSKADEKRRLCNITELICNHIDDKYSAVADTPNENTSANLEIIHSELDSKVFIIYFEE